MRQNKQHGRCLRKGKKDPRATKPSLKGGDYCCVVGCRSNAVDLRTWRGEKCEIHDVPHYACPCNPPFSLYYPPFKQHPEWILPWQKAVNRKNFRLTRHTPICSRHFTDNAPSTINPFPTLQLGYDLHPESALLTPTRSTNNSQGKRKLPQNTDHPTCSKRQNHSQSEASNNVALYESVEPFPAAVVHQPCAHDANVAAEMSTTNTSNDDNAEHPENQEVDQDQLLKLVDKLKREIEKLRREKEEAKAKIHMSYNNIKVNDKLFKFYTGITRELFYVLFEHVEDKAKFLQM